MALPDGFSWQHKIQGEAGPPTVVVYRMRWVAQLIQRTAYGQWFARLDIQAETSGRGWRTRECHSEATGRAGIEAWVTRHRDRLAAGIDSQRLHDDSTGRYLDRSMDKPRAQDLRSKSRLLAGLAMMQGGAQHRP